MDNRKMLMESYDIRLKRVQYLKDITRYRNEGYNIIYTDETYIHSSHTPKNDWADDKMKTLRKPISKGRRLIIVHAGGETGFVDNALLIFRSGKLMYMLLAIINFNDFILYYCFDHF